jgi:hypothetical protein
MSLEEICDKDSLLKSSIWVRKSPPRLRTLPLGGGGGGDQEPWTLGHIYIYIYIYICIYTYIQVARAPRIIH